MQRVGAFELARVARVAACANNLLRDVSQERLEPGLGDAVPCPARLEQEVGAVDAGPGPGVPAARPRREPAARRLHLAEPFDRRNDVAVDRGRAGGWIAEEACQVAQ